MTHCLMVCQSFSKPHSVVNVRVEIIVRILGSSCDLVEHFVVTGSFETRLAQVSNGDTPVWYAPSYRYGFHLITLELSVIAGM